jgi:hypothetical protein
MPASTFSQKGIERIQYEETEHYWITRDFLMNPGRMLKFLMERRMRLASGAGWR